MTLLADLRRPFNAISLAIGVIGVLIGIYFYIAGKAEREPIFQSYKASQIFDRDNPTKAFKVIDSDDNPIESSIFITEFALWNEGKIAVSANDVRTPVHVCFAGAERLLDYSLVFDTMSDEENYSGMNYKLGEPEDGNEPCVAIQFKHLDINHGARFSVVYSASKPIEPKISGVIYGSRIPIRNDPSIAVSRWVIISIACIVPSLVLLIFAITFRETLLPKREEIKIPSSKSKMVLTFIFSVSIFLMFVACISSIMVLININVGQIQF